MAEETTEIIEEIEEEEPQPDLQEAVKWFKSRIPLPGFKDDMWTPLHDQSVFDFLTCTTVSGDAKAYRLFATYDDSGKFVLTPVLPENDTKEVVYFLRSLNGRPNYNDLTSCIQWGHMQGRAVNQLLTSLDGFFLPLFVKSDYLPDSIKTDIMPEMNKFLGLVTEASNSFYGQTVLYIPQENLKDVTKCSQDRALVQRLETTVIQWTTQLKTPLNPKCDQVGPLAEIEEWEFRLKTCQSLKQQIESTPIQQVVAVLSAVKSRYLSDFQAHYKKMKDETVMAKSIIRHLRILIEPCNQLIAGEVSECTDLLRKILFAIRFIYEKCPYYADEQHLSLLLKRVSDLVMHFITSKINLNNVFSLEGDVNHGLDILTIAVTVGESWNSTYKVAMRAVKSKDPNAWNFDHTQLFANFDAFISRCGDLKEICQNTIQFTRKRGTEAVPIPTFPGSIGSSISASIQEIQDSYIEVLKRLENADCNVFDVSDNKWHTEFNQYCESCANLESLFLNAIQTQFEAARTPTLALQLLEIFEDLAVRDGVKHLVTVKASDLWKLFQQEVIAVRREFENLKTNPPLLPHQSRQAGTIIWARSLAHRIQQPYEQISNASWLPPYQYKSEVIASYTGIISSINDFINNTFNEYHKTIVESVRQALNKQILVKSSTTSIRTSLEDNFVQAIEEVSHFIRMGFIISSTAHDLAQLRERNRLIVECVLNVVRDYNTIYECLRADEQLLFHDHFQKIERRIGDALTTKVHWANVSVVNTFVNSSVKELHQLHTIIVGFKQTAADIVNACKVISRVSIVQVQPGKQIFRADEFKSVQQGFHDKALEQIRETYDATIARLQKMFSKFHINTLEVKEQWLSFLINVDRQLEVAFKQTANKALSDLKRAITDETYPLFISQMDLINGSCQIAPSFDDIKGTLTYLVNGAIRISEPFVPAYWHLKDTITVVPDEDADENEYAKLHNPNYVFVPGQHHFESYYSQVAADPEIVSLVRQIEEVIGSVDSPIQQQIDNWRKYESIWVTDKPTELHRIAETTVTLSDFESRIDVYRTQSTEIQNTESTNTQGFIRLDSSPLQNSLLTHCSDWTSRLIALLNSVSREKLHSFYDMFTEKKQKMQQVPTTIPELGELLQFMAEVKESIPKTEALFAPVQENFDALARFEYNVDPKDVELLNTLAERWKEFKDAVVLSDKQLEQHRDQFKKMHIAEVDEIRQLQTDMYNQFMMEEPFKSSHGYKAAYEILDRYDERVRQLRLREDNLRPGCELFKLDPPVYKEISTVKSDIGLLRQIWQLYDEWDNMWTSWSNQPFKKLEVANMENAAVAQGKLVANLGLKNWDVAQVLTQKIVQFKKTMPLIANLKEPAIGPRHWNILMKELDVTFDPNADSFTLSSIYEMKFNEHGDVIATIAMIAKKEFEVQQGIDEITERWGNTHFETKPYAGAYQIIESDKIFDQIEQDQTMLSGMKATLGGMKATRFFSPFDQTTMNRLEVNLTKVLELLDMLLTVQRQWIYLEAIFTGSESIRKDLLNQASEFNKVHTKWRDIMEVLRRDSTTCFRALQEQDLMGKLRAMNEKLEEIQKVLEQFLQTKRNSFPRFYFLSNDDLLQIISNQKDPDCVQDHLKKMFGGMTKLKFVDQPNSEGKNQKVATVMYSAEGEEVRFENPVVAAGDVDIWLREIEAEMRRTVHAQLGRCRTAIIKTNHIDKAKVLKDDAFPGQCFITAGQIKWTAECERALEASQKASEAAGGKQVKVTTSHPLNQLLGSQILFIRELTNMIRENLSPLLRKKVKALLIIEDHARDVITDIIRYAIDHQGAVTKDDFVWLKQLRFYWLKENEFCTIQQTFSSFEYDKEYIGNAPRLVITPLTDRCYLTLTSALQFKCGGNPQGPAGTGKTETVKDLAKAFAKFCIVFNCSEGLDFKSMANIFTGLATTGAWSCFDEFNRIEVEVLSVIAQQVQRLLDGIAAGASQVCLDAQMIKLNPTCAIFVTMNPGYAGRSELPDNLKTLLRPVSMMVPDCSLIVKIELMSEGVAAGESLARKITTLYDLAKRQLSKQDHYDFGLRAIKSVLSMAGSLKRSNSGLSDELIVLRSMTNMNIPKLVTEDIPLFQSIMSDLFPDTELEPAVPGEVENAVVEALQQQQLLPEPQLVHKIMQLYDTMQTRHGNMLVGQTGSGKTTAYTTLAMALNNIGRTTLTYLLNPKALSLGELYGAYDLNTRQWSDGVLSTVVQNVSIMPGDDLRWVIFDGPVDTLWIESMNSVLDENKVLTLINSARISLPPPVGLVFEVEDLAVASPATVSRCGMIYFEQSTIGYRSYLTSWMNRFITNERHRNKFTALQNKYVDLFIEYKHQALHDLIPVTDLNAIQTFCRLYEACATKENGVDPSDEMNHDIMVESWFWFCLVWSIGGSLDEEGRKEADLWIRDLESPFPAKDTVYDYYVDVQKHCLSPWEDKLPSAWKTPDLPFNQILVPTVDTLRNSFLLRVLTTAHVHTLFVGLSGVGKTAVIENTISTYDNRHSSLTINLSSRTSSNKMQEMIENAFEIRTKSTYVPIGGKELSVFIDDFNMPARDLFGSQPPLELLRQWMETGSWYDREKCTLKYLKDMQIIAAMAPPGGGRQPISRRLQSKFALFNVPNPSETQLKRIFNTLLANHLAGFSEDVQSIAENITAGTLELFQNVQKQFLPTPNKSHYVFNLRDMSRVFQGLLDANTQYFDDRAAFVKLWCHECYRVFGDRLTNEDDRQAFGRLVSAELNTALSSTWAALFREEPEPTPHGAFEQDGVTWPYREYVNFSELHKKLSDRLQEYNEMGNNVPMNLVLFKEAVYHCCRIMRIIGRQFGHALLIGLGGSGRQSQCRLAAYTLEMQFFQITITKGYKERDFRDDIKRVLDMTALERKPTVFFFSDNQILQESFLEDVIAILTSGCVPNLFEGDELAQRREAMRAEATKRNIPQTPQNLFNLYVQLSRENLHIVFSMSPAGDALRNRIRMFPPLVNNTTIDWFNEWPSAALQSVAENIMRDVEFSSEEQKAQIISSFVEFHNLAEASCNKMQQQLKRPFQLTPTTFMEFVKSYKSLLARKQLEVTKKADKYRNGLSTLISTRADVETMSHELEKKRVLVEQKKAECEAMSLEVTTQKKQAEDQEKHAKAMKIEASKKAEEVKVRQAEAEAALALMKPQLDAAEKALEDIKQNINQIHEIASYKESHGAIVPIVEALMILLGKSTNFQQAKVEMRDPSIASKLQNFPRDDISKATLKKLSRYMRMNDLKPEVAVKTSFAGSLLAAWIGAMYSYGNAYQEIHPLMVKVEQIQEELEAQYKELEKTEKRLEELKNYLDELRRKRDAQQLESEKLQQEQHETEVRLKRANDLVNGLVGERTRWEESIKNFDQLLTWLPADCFLASAFLIYCGPLPADYRQQLIQKWRKFLRTKNQLPVNPDFTPTRLLVEPVAVQQWHLNGLAQDDFSEDNATLVLNGDRWPLCIDPQNQANQWIKKMYKDRLLVMTTKKPKFDQHLEIALQNGTPVLLQDMSEDIDPSLMPIINREFVKQGTTLLFKLGGDRLVALHPDFRLFMTTKMSNPEWTPEVTSRTTVVNFSVKEQGLEEQMLGIVVGKERPELETEKVRLVTQMAEDKQTLYDTEQRILALLASKTSTELLNDDTVVSTLEQSKTLSQNISEKLKSAADTEKKIDAAREAYRSVARRASSLFFVLSDLAYVDPMYQFSLDAYTVLFSHSLANAQHSDDAEKRNEIIKDDHTLAVYRNTCRGLFEQHKLLFSFCLAVKVQQTGDQRGPGRVAADEYLYFLRGPVGLSPEVLESGVRPEWLPQREWENILGLNTLPAFDGIAASFEQYNDDWYAWYMSQQPELVPFPGDWTRRCTLMQSMVIVRCLRPDRLLSCITSYIENTLGEDFVKPPPLELAAALHDSDAYTPLLFVLSPGVDPLLSLKRLATDMKVPEDQFHDLALGQGQADAARQLIIEGSEKGWWVYLSNCHLMLSWMDEFEGIIEEISLTKIHPKFRLWLSSDPNPKFPISILQKSVKMTTESPSGIHANMKSLYSSIPADLDRQTPQFKKLVFSLCYLHSVIIERRKFLTLGWNIPYPFNRADFDICQKVILRLIETSPRGIPWEAMRYLISEIHYGGRVTDSWDQRLLDVYVHQYFCPELISSHGFKLCENNLYFVPEPTNIADALQVIEKIPITDPPEAFGQHPNADISSLIQESQSLLSTVLSLQPALSSAAGQSREDIVLGLAKEMLFNVPPCISLPRMTAQQQQDALTIVLFQEIARYNKLLVVVHDSLDELILGIQGLVVMSNELDEVFTCIYQNRVPEMWQFAYPSLKPLAEWMKDLVKRIKFFKKWLEKGEPSAFWLGRFTYPTSFLTAVLQRSARLHRISIDQLDWQFKVMHTKNIREIVQQALVPDEGVLIRGLYLEGARWSKKENSLANPKPLQLIDELPIVHFLPVDKTKKPKQKCYIAPAYIYPVRGGTSEHPSLVLPIELPTKEEPEFWVKRGCAILLTQQ